MRLIRALSFTVVLATAISGRTLAQSSESQDAATDRSGQMVASGILGGVVGAAVGAGGGVVLEGLTSGVCQDWCGVAGFALGSFAGATLGSAFGVHTGNQRRGEFRAALLGAALVSAGTVLLIHRVPEGPTPKIAIGLLIPLQVIAASEGERRSMRPPN